MGSNLLQPKGDLLHLTFHYQSQCWNPRFQATLFTKILSLLSMGNAALSLEWVECMRKICLLELKSADLRIYFFSSQVRLLFQVGPWLVLNAVKHCIFRKSAAVLISFRFKTAKFFRGNVFPIKCKRMCFLKERCGAYFVGRRSFQYMWFG